jgi:2'-5' RNA ligase
VRLFVAVEIGSDVQRAAERVIGELKRRVEHSAPRAHVSWVKVERLHLTVRFIGQVDEVVGRRLREALEGPLSTAAFECTIAGTGTFPPRRPPRVVWAGVAAGLEQLQAVEQEVRSRLDALTPVQGDRVYHPHLTLARIKDPTGLKPASLLAGLENVVFGTVRVGAVTLFESRLSSEPAYVPLGRTLLRHT